MADTAAANANPDQTTDAVLPTCSPLKSVHAATDDAPSSEQPHTCESSKSESKGDVANGHVANGHAANGHATHDDQPANGEVKDHTDGAHSSKSVGAPKVDGAVGEDCSKADDSSKPDDSGLAKPVEPSSEDLSKPDEASKSEEAPKSDEPATSDGAAKPEEQAAASANHEKSVGSLDKPVQDVPATTGSEDPSPKLHESAKPDEAKTDASAEGQQSEKLIPATTGSEDPSPKLHESAKPDEAKTDASAEGQQSEKPKDSEAEEGKVELLKEEKSKTSPKSCSPL